MFWTARFVLTALLLAPLTAVAAEDGPTTFLGVKVKPHKGTYLVLRDVNIRAQPATKSKRVGSLKSGKKIEVVARVGGVWVAVREKGKDLGFVYNKVLMPLIDGTLTEDLTGRVMTGDGVDCGYTIRFVARSPIEGQVFQIADYDVFWDCLLGKKKIKFRTPMFMTEAPFQMGLKRIYQISVDVLEIDNDYDDIFSSIVLYDQDKKRVLFDSVSIKKFGRTPKPAKTDAKTVAEALAAAVKISALSWKSSVWKAVGGSTR